MIEKSRSFSTEKAQFATRTIESLYRFSIHNSEALAETQELLRENSGRNLLLYFNHISFPDPVFAIWLHQKFLNPNLSRKVIVPASYLHTQFKYNPAFTTAFNLGQFFYSFEGVRLVQNYMVGDRYTQEQANKSYRQLIQAIKDKHNKQPTSLIIAPEGHRSDDGLTLQTGNPGLVSLAKMLTPVLTLPLGISYPDRQNKRNGLNFGQNISLNLGEPQVIEDRTDARLSLEHLMLSLAITLPEDMRGCWV